MSDATHPPIKRLPTGLPALDSILNGGFLQGGIYMMVGTPGAGKTILGNQLCFNHVSHGGRAIYMTLLAETHARMLAHINQMSFFDPTPVGDTLTYLSGFTTLEKEGFPGLLKFITRAVREHHATLLVIDGLATAVAISPTHLDYRRFLHELQVLVETLGCTAFLLNQPARESLHHEHTMVDGLLYMADRLVGPRAVRELEVTKFRGSNFLRGRHPFEITNDGIVLHPRLEALLPHPSRPAMPHEDRKSFGIRRLDDMTMGGIPSGSTTVLLGAPGSGKTILGLHFLHQGLRQGESATYLGFYESPQRLLAKAKALGMDLETYVQTGQLDLIWLPAPDQIPDAIADTILRSARDRAVKRLVIDGVEPIQDSMIYEDRVPRFLTSFMNELRARDITAIFTSEMPDLFSDRIYLPIERMAGLVDNVLFVRYVELRSQLYRLLSIMKMRDSAYDTTIREFKIGPHGISVASTFKSAEAILTGVARPLPTTINRDRSRTTRTRTEGDQDWDDPAP
jgi:circadian clock protein KaiC